MLGHYFLLILFTPWCLSMKSSLNPYASSFTPHSQQQHHQQQQQQQDQPTLEQYQVEEGHWGQRNQQLEKESWERELQRFHRDEQLGQPKVLEERRKQPTEQPTGSTDFSYFHYPSFLPNQAIMLDEDANNPPSPSKPSSAADPLGKKQTVDEPQKYYHLWPFASQHAKKIANKQIGKQSLGIIGEHSKRGKGPIAVQQSRKSPEKEKIDSEIVKNIDMLEKSHLEKLKGNEHESQADQKTGKNAEENRNLFGTKLEGSGKEGAEMPKNEEIKIMVPEKQKQSGQIESGGKMAEGKFSQKQPKTSASGPSGTEHAYARGEKSMSSPPKSRKTGGNESGDQLNVEKTDRKVRRGSKGRKKVEPVHKQIEEEEEIHHGKNATKGSQTEAEISPKIKSEKIEQDPLENKEEKEIQQIGESVQAADEAIGQHPYQRKSDGVVVEASDWMPQHHHKQIDAKRAAKQRRQSSDKMKEKVKAEEKHETSSNDENPFDLLQQDTPSVSEETMEGDGETDEEFLSSPSSPEFFDTNEEFKNSPEKNKKKLKKRGKGRSPKKTGKKVGGKKENIGLSQIVQEDETIVENALKNAGLLSTTDSSDGTDGEKKEKGGEKEVTLKSIQKGEEHMEKSIAAGSLHKKLHKKDKLVKGATNLGIGPSSSAVILPTPNFNNEYALNKINEIIGKLNQLEWIKEKKTPTEKELKYLRASYDAIVGFLEKYWSIFSPKDNTKRRAFICFVYGNLRGRVYESAQKDLQEVDSVKKGLEKVGDELKRFDEIMERSLQILLDHGKGMDERVQRFHALPEKISELSWLVKNAFQALSDPGKSSILLKIRFQMMEEFFKQHLNEDLKQILSLIFVGDMKDPRMDIDWLTITQGFQQLIGWASNEKQRDELREIVEILKEYSAVENTMLDTLAEEENVTDVFFLEKEFVQDSIGNAFFQKLFFIKLRKLN